MKRLILLSTLTLISACAKIKETPVDEFYIADLANNVCVKYAVIDKEALKFGDPVDMPLVPKGPCDRMVGVKLQDWSALKNWIRDNITDGKKKTIQLP